MERTRTSEPVSALKRVSKKVVMKAKEREASNWRSANIVCHGLLAAHMSTFSTLSVCHVERRTSSQPSGPSGNW